MGFDGRWARGKGTVVVEQGNHKVATCHQPFEAFNTRQISSKPESDQVWTVTAVPCT